MLNIIGKAYDYMCKCHELNIQETCLTVNEDLIK